MIKRNKDLRIVDNEAMRGGPGVVTFEHFVDQPEEMCDKGTVFAKVTLKPGCGIGYHVHETNTELMYILSGEADYDNNGTLEKVYGGDVTICPPGEGHSITNNTNDIVEFIALILNK